MRRGNNNMNNNGWISVNDRLPELKDGIASDRVLIARGVKNKVVGFGWYRIHEWITSDNYPFCKQELITHWMPIPKPPKEVK